MRRICISLIITLLLLSHFTVDSSARTYLTKAQALKQVFPTSTEIKEEKKVLTTAQKREIEKKLGRKLKETSFTFYLGMTEGRIDGYALILDEIGKHRPITFIIAIDPGGKVKDVTLMVFRETRGDIGRKKRFFRQYRGKTSQDPIKLHRDIDAVTGATLSARAANVAVKKALVLYEELYLGGKQKVQSEEKNRG
ncbi:MAG: FMN-binding protein [bacterium]